MLAIDTHVVSDVGDLLTYLRKAGQSGHTWFRGQNCVSWNLQPQVCRSGRHNEFDLLKTFYQRGGHQPGAPGDNDLGHWLSLAQHFGLPTRLLDWTESFLTAAYFAVNALPLRARCDDQTRDGAIWLLKPHGMNEAFSKPPYDNGVLSEADEPVLAALLPAFGMESPFGPDRQPPYFAYSPQHRFARMAAQKACFTWHRDNAPLEATESAKNFLRRVIVPGSMKLEIAEHLMVLGITHSTPFPDFGGLADELKIRVAARAI